MEKKNQSHLLLLPLPAITFLSCIFFALFINNSYSIDPDFAYLFNGLNIIRGENFAITHVDHPGTPLQVLIGIFIIIIGTVRGADNFTADVMNDPQVYIKTIIIVISFFFSMVLYFAGKRYKKYQQSLPGALIIQLSFLLFSAVTITSSKLFTETIIPLGAIIIVLFTIERTWGTMKDWIYALSSGITLGIFIATKITFLPVFFIPFIVISKWRNKLIYLITAVGFFVISILPVMDKLVMFKSFLLKIATHEGTYGGGKEETLNVFSLLSNLWKTLQAEYTFTLIFFFCLTIVIIAFKKIKFGVFKDKEIRLLLAIIFAFILQLLIVGKHYGYRYMIPVLLFSGLAFATASHRIKEFKPWYCASLIIIVILSGFYNVKMLRKALRINEAQNRTYAFVQKTIAPHDPLLVISKESWYGTPFISHSLMFGKQYCFRQGEQYAGVLDSLYPNKYFWTHSNQQYSDWQMPVMPDQLLNNQKRLFLYIQTDNPGLYKKAIDDFSIHLKYTDTGSVTMKLIYSNPEMDEEIYLLEVSNPIAVKPGTIIESGFEVITEDGQFLKTNHDSIAFQEAWRLNDSQVFEGKYSVCIKPDNPFGISTTIPEVSQYGFVHISFMCRRSSPRHECCIGIKSSDPNEGFNTLGSVSTETINGWEKIDYAYFFNHEPAGHRVVMFIWNNSSEPMYFDNLRIERY